MGRNTSSLVQEKKEFENYRLKSARLNEESLKLILFLSYRFLPSKYSKNPHIRNSLFQNRPASFL